MRAVIYPNMDSAVEPLQELGYRAYHYTTLEKFRDIVQSQELWLTNKESGSFTDEYELYYSYDNLQSDLNKLGKPYSEYLNGTDSDTIRKNMEKMKKALFISCFSKTFKNRYLWKNYAGTSGVCIEFDIYRLQELMYVDGKSVAFFGDVNYISDLNDASILVKQAIDDPHINHFSNPKEKALIAWLRLFPFIKRTHSDIENYESEMELRYVFNHLNYETLCKTTDLKVIEKIQEFKEETGLDGIFEYPLKHKRIKLSAMRNSENAFPFLKIYYNCKDDKSKICQYLGVINPPEGFLEYIDVSKLD